MHKPASRLTRLTAGELEADLARTLPAWREYLDQLVVTQFEHPPVDTPPLVGDAARHFEAQREIWSREA